jgi:hypothetical protein
MPLSTPMALMSTAEFLMWTALAVLFWRKHLHRRFPAISRYLGLRVLSSPLLLGILYVQGKPWGVDIHFLYFFAYWAIYVASAAMLFFICIEIFRSMLAPFTGLLKLGTIAFRWAALVSSIVSLATIPYGHRGVLVMSDIAYGLMRSVSVLELCLLAFLCLSMNALKLPLRDLSFGFALGFGVVAANDFVLAALISANPSFAAPLQIVYETVLLCVVCFWVVYCALPEPARKPVVMAANSTIYRWNEIAAALGHGTKIAVQQPANSFFLTDVEKVVDKVLTRTNLQGNESM